jgi:hypothetical protein
MTTIAEWYAAQPFPRKIEAARRLAALCHARALYQSGFSQFVCDVFAAQAARCHWRTIQRWRQHVVGIALTDPDALYWLCPHRNPGRRRRYRGEKA